MNCYSLQHFTTSQPLNDHRSAASLTDHHELGEVTQPLKEGCSFENPPKKGNYVPLIIGAEDSWCGRVYRSSIVGLLSKQVYQWTFRKLHRRPS